MKTYINDTDILAALQQGDSDAFNHIYKLYFKPLSYFAEKITGSNVVAEDMATETFVKLLQKKPTFDSLQNLKSFLYTTTRNGCYDQLRMKKRHELSHLEIKSMAVLSEDEIEQNIIMAEVLQGIYAAIEGVPEKYKQVIKLALVQGKDNDEIVAETGMAYQTVRNHKSEGIKLLRLALYNNTDLTSSTLLLCLIILGQHLTVA